MNSSHAASRGELFKGFVRLPQNQNKIYPVDLLKPLLSPILRAGGRSEMAKAKLKSRYNLGYGAVYVRKTKKGNIRWYLDYRNENGERIQKVAMHAQSQEEAAMALQKEVSLVFAKKQGIKEEKRIAFDDFSSLFLENYSKPNKKSWICDYYCLNAHLKPYFGRQYLREITPLQIESYRTERLKSGVARSSTNRETALLKKMFNLAIDWEYCSSNPVSKVKLFSEKDNLKERVLSDEEEEKLLAHCPSHLKPIIVTALNTGMRKNEILRLKWSQVDLTNRTIRATKTKSGRDRFIPINDAVHEVLLLQKQRTNGDYVFPNPENNFPFKTVRKGFEASCRRAGISNLRFHDLRHTFATRLIRKGVDIVTVQNLLGHHSLTITQRYTHSSIPLKREAVDLLVEKSSKSERNSTNLLHTCDTENQPAEQKAPSPLLSMN